VIISGPNSVKTEICSLDAGKLDDVLNIWQAFVPTVTLWVFSTDNRDRPLERISCILIAVEAKVRTLADPLKIHRR